jgi:DNA primase
MLIDRVVAEQVAERHPPATFRHAAYRELFAALLHASADEPLDLLAERVSEDAVRILLQLTEGTPLDPEASDIPWHLDCLDARQLEERIEAIREAMRHATRDEQDALMKERMELEADMRRLKPVRAARPRSGGSRGA